MNTLQKQMANISTTNRIPTVSSFHRLYSNRLRICLTNYYMKALPLNDQLRARRELKLVKSIRRKLKKYHFILRKTDKSGVFHIGHSKDYRRKAREYREKTGAYEQLNQNPYNDLIYHVTHQLNQLKATKKITEGQRLQMVPIREKTQLAYMYFLPKSHKVLYFFFLYHLHKSNIIYLSYSRLVHHYDPLLIRSMQLPKEFLDF